MSVRAVDGPPGAPWAPPLHGILDRLVVESDALRENPLGDPARRPLHVYRPPGVERDHPRALSAVFVIQGFTGQLDMWDNRTAFEPSFVERLDALYATHECPDAIVVLVDAWTSYGGSQFINSTGTGDYLDYLCDEIVPFIDAHYPTAAAAEHRGIAGKSSGGYGAMVVPMLRPDVFGALASHAGDALFEACYLPEFPQHARVLRDRYDGSWDRLLEAFATRTRYDHQAFGPLESYGYAACYSPDPDRPGRALVPFDAHGRLLDDVWARWLEWDPVRMAPAHADALRGLKRIVLDAGRSDEYYLDLGAAAFAAELGRLGVTTHSLELFDGTHSGLTYRYPAAIAELVRALDPA